MENYKIVFKIGVTTFVCLLLLFFVGRWIPWSAVAVLRGLLLFAITRYFLKKYKQNSISLSTIILGILIARYIGNIHWIFWGFKGSWGILLVDIIDLMAILLGFISYLKNKWYINIITLLILAACYSIYFYCYF